ncbi:MAG: peptidylprolyl isomerase [Treponema sp.]|jgi:hypothetical protein|nr:peptidylprolyl isomerase [Treponema sp.]
MASKGKKPVQPDDESLKFDFIRRFKANPFLFIGTLFILVIVIVAFVFVPAFVPEAQTGGRELVFGMYNKTPIRYVPGNVFSQAYSAASNTRRPQGDSGDYFIDLQNMRQAFEETVVHIAVLDEMKRAGYTVPAETVDEAVAELFLDANGRFSASRYNSLDNTEKKALWRSREEGIIKERYMSDMINLRVSSKETSFISSMAKPQRTVDMAAYSFSSYPESEIQAFARNNPDIFRITHLFRITVESSEAEAREVLTAVQEGAVFEDQARLHSKDAYKDSGGDMGVKMFFELESEVPDAEARDALVRLEKGALSDIFKVTSGWAFFRAEENPSPVDTSVAANMDKIRYYMQDRERGLIEDYLIARADELVALCADIGFDEALLQKGIEKRSIGPLPLNYGNVDLFPSLSYFATDLTDAETNENFWQAAFFTPMLTASQPLVIGNSIFVLYPREETYEVETGMIESYYPTAYLGYLMDRSIRSHFINSNKLEDKFYDTYFGN